MKRTSLLAALTIGFLAVFAAPASAHTSNVSHAETCADDGTTTTVVTFDNDYNLAADVGYQWGTENPGTVHMAAKTGTANPTVSLPAHGPGVLAWHVTWADGFRQPTEGESTLTVVPLTGCHAATTTTTVPVTTTTVAATTSTLPATTTTTAKATVVPTTTTTTPAAVLGTTRTLPRTGFPFAFYTAIGLIALLLGGLALYTNRVEKG